MRAMTRRGCCGRRVQTMRACAYVLQSRDGEAAAQGGDGRRKGGRKTRERRDDEWRDDEVGGRSRFCRRRVERRVIGVWLSQDPSSGRGVETEGERRWGVRVVIGCGGAGRMDQARGRRGSSAVRYHLGSLGVNAEHSCWWPAGNWRAATRAWLVTDGRCLQLSAARAPGDAVRHGASLFGQCLLYPWRGRPENSELGHGTSWKSLRMYRTLCRHVPAAV